MFLLSSLNLIKFPRYLNTFDLEEGENRTRDKRGALAAGCPCHFLVSVSFIREIFTQLIAIASVMVTILRLIRHTLFRLPSLSIILAAAFHAWRYSNKIPRIVRKFLRDRSMNVFYQQEDQREEAETRPTTSCVQFAELYHDLSTSLCNY